MNQLNIDGLISRVPIIQGGMGVKVSGANLASAVANTGCAGIIASAGLGQFENHSLISECMKINEDAFRFEIRKAKKQTRRLPCKRAWLKPRAVSWAAGSPEKDS